jgi:sugar/nucleoside kinase (ribokinase family)
VSKIAIAGNVSVDRVDDRPPSPGGCPSFAAAALRILGGGGEIVTRHADGDRELFGALLTGLGVPVTVLPASTTSAFGLRYSGEQRRMTVDAIGDPWTPSDLSALPADAVWVHVAPLLRSDFPGETLQALAATGRRISYDGQGLVRVPRVGDLTVDARYEPAVVAALSVLKLAEDEASVIAPRGFDRTTARALQVPEILVTFGSEGCDVYIGDECDHVPAAWRVEGVQTTGAGDAFMVGYVHARAQAATPVEAARAASEVVARMLDERKAASYESSVSGTSGTAELR